MSVDFFDDVFSGFETLDFGFEFFSDETGRRFLELLDVTIQYYRT